MTIKTKSSSQSICFYLRDSSGKKIGFDSGDFISTDDPYNWGYESASEYLVFNKGTYYLEAYNYRGITTNYNFTLKTVVGQSKNLKIAGLKNNTLSTANAITVGQKAKGVAGSYDSPRYYKLNVPYTMKVCFKVNCSDEEWFVLSLKNSAGKEIDSVNNYTDYWRTQKTDYIKWTKSLAKGTYYLEVVANEPIVYTMNITKVKSSQSITAKFSSKKLKYKTLRSKALSFNIGAKAKTKLTYSSSSKYLKVSSKGKVTVKKKTPKGSYTITVRASDSAAYKSAVKKIKIKVA